MPHSAVSFDQLSELGLLFLSPLSFVVVRVEPSAAQVVARLHRAIREALSDLRPRAVQLLR